MKDTIETTRRQLGELGAMAHKTQEEERKILERAESMLADVEQKLEAERPAAQRGDEAAETRYTELVQERGRLHTVIARAREVLADAA